MKKILTLTAVAAMLLASCTNEETVQVNNNGKAIGFDTFVGKVTRGEVSKDNLESFYVYGRSTATQFKATPVTKKSDNSWSYDDTQYWENGKNYTFAAVYPAVTDATFDLANLSIKGYNVAEGTDDLIVSVTTSIPGKDAGNDPVTLTFSHALSQVKFSFTGATSVSGIKLSGVDSKADLTVNNNAGNNIEWDNAGSAKEYNVTSGTALFLLPQEVSANMELSFTADSKEYTIKLNTATTPVSEWENGKSYSYNVNLGDAKSIQFTANVDAWTSTDAKLNPETSGEDVEPEPEPDPTPGPEEPEIKTAIMPSLADGQIRNDTNHTFIASDAEMELSYYEDNNTIIYGLITFGIPEDLLNSDSELVSASMRLVTSKCNGGEQVNVYDLGEKFTESDDASTLWAKCEEIAKQTYFTKFNRKGHNTYSLGDYVNPDKGGKKTDQYGTVEDWTNNIDITDYLQNNKTNNYISLLLTKDTSHAQGMKFATKETTGYEGDGLTFSADELKPQLTIIYKVKK